MYTFLTAVQYIEVVIQGGNICRYTFLIAVQSIDISCRQWRIDGDINKISSQEPQGQKSSI
jgi:hypothetical protein